MKGMKTGGRQKGTTNKPKPNIKVLEKVIGAYFDDTEEGISQFAKDLGVLEPGERLTHVKDFMPYLYPRLQTVQVDATIEADVTFEKEIMKML